MQLVRRAHLIVAWALVAGVVFQVFLAGRGVFESGLRFKDHAGWGYLLEMVALLLLILAAAGGAGRRQVGYAALILGMFVLQSVFIAVRGDLPLVAALHPVNGFGILLVSVLSAREAWASRSAAAGEATVAATSPAAGTASR